MSVESDLHIHHGQWTEPEYLALPDDRRRVELLDGARAIKPRLYAEAGIPHYLRVELASSGPVAVLHRMRGGRYVAGEAGSVLRLERPFPVEVDLAALLSAKRPPRT